MIALSHVEAKFVALGEAVREAPWIKNLLTEINQTKVCADAIEIMVDNQGTIRIAENYTISERTKHMYLRKFFCPRCCRK